ncbi:hypothetical protein Acr_28g0007770 [Actinidia rufa]|uniref:Embryonic stem cell-specific 5-hydroxymethylcytosine-binding protein n=1 Tax=Actinidia rufa TaxID=165716 RepID=A0A7J0HAD0_9ERIC|nr:hypothetical protein Acr_28g0007770 [Actinidia rufa]
MCGRARCTLRADDIPRACRLNGRFLRSVDMDRYRPSYNVAPGRDMPVVRRDDGSGGDGAVLHCMKWGLIPSFTKKSEKPDHYKMFNARSESICEKASFRRLVPNSRCLVVVEGFYEWKKDGSKKQPYYIHFKDGRSLVFAALYDSWKNSEGEILYTFTIVTTSSSSTLEWLHERMPVILGDKESTDTWLFGSTPSKFETLLKPYEETDLIWYPVTPAMDKVEDRGDKTRSQSFSQRRDSIADRAQALGARIRRSFKTNQPKSLKEEPPETEDSVDRPSVIDKPNNESKPNVSTHCCEGVANLPIKRDYEDISVDTKPSIGKGDKPRTSPLRKKGNLGAAAMLLLLVAQSKHKVRWEFRINQRAPILSHILQIESEKRIIAAFEERGKDTQNRKGQHGADIQSIEQRRNHTLKRFRNGSQRSRIADIGWRSHGMLGNQLSKTLTSKTPLYIWSHLAMPTTTTDNGVFSRTMVARSGFILAKNNGPRVPKLGLAQTPFNWSPNTHNFEAIRFETERAIANRVVIVRVDPASGVWVSLGIVGEDDGEEEAKSLDLEREGEGSWVWE